jgi:hypothetical protein
MKTKYPDIEMKDADELAAYHRAERRRMAEEKFNRLRITEKIRDFNIEVKRNYTGDERKRKSMSKAKLAAEVFPNVRFNTACSYIAEYNSGSRFRTLTPAVIITIANVLKCDVADLFEIK